jgi:serine/threonine-protein kinase
MATGKSYLPFGASVVSWRDVTYVKIGNLGSGGSSDAYLTLATSGPRRGIAFAVKIFKALSREEWRLNFMREVHVLRDCDHPAIMRVFDEGLYRDEYPFVVMEYLPETLSKAMQAGGLADEDQLSVVMQLLSALNYLSRRDPPVVHRDIKPSNIFLKKGSCVLGDFGLILQVGEAEQPERGKGAAQPVPEMARNYRTPELVSYHNGGPRPPPKSDLFQLGLVAAELFTGKNPLLPDRPEKPLRMQAISEVPGPLGAPIRSLLEQMLIAETAQRPSASDLLGKWQELYLALRRREHAERRAGRLQRPAEEGE